MGHEVEVRSSKFGEGRHRLAPKVFRGWKPMRLCRYRCDCGYVLPLSLQRQLVRRVNETERNKNVSCLHYKDGLVVAGATSSSGLTLFVMKKYNPKNGAKKIIAQPNSKDNSL
jgi:hypothetical protein